LVLPVLEGARRRSAVAALALVTLVLGVAVAHWWALDNVWPDRLGQGAADTRPLRMEVSFVRELQAAAPPLAPLRSVPLAALAAPRPAAVAASAPAAAASSPSPTPPPPAATAEPEPKPSVAAVQDQAPLDPKPAAEATSSAVTVTTAAAAMAAASQAAPGPAATAAEAFEWPPSTRLSYRVSGHFRGPVEGQARVEWLRSGSRYQVHMDVGIGPAFAPLLSRRVSSEGDITAQGLYPDRYDEETRALLQEPRRLKIEFAPDSVRLANGNTMPRPPGVQDSASQFVQLTWLFTTQPQLLQVGQSVALPLALPRQLQVWTYDVLAEVSLDTPVGPVPTWHVKPRRVPGVGAGTGAGTGGALAAEVWFAPSLQYLPVRILIRQDGDNFIDLLIERLPQQAERGR